VGREITDFGLDLGFDTASVASRIVSGLVPGSVAERAGVRDGDYIVRIPNFSDMERAPREEIEVRLRRAGSDLSVHFTPVGPPVRSYEWTLRPHRVDGLDHVMNDSRPHVRQQLRRWLCRRSANGIS
jgi:hypothetical protein